jgi:serine/threonine protein kinase
MAQIVRDVARGLAYLHQLGYLHLDVTPSNVMLTRRVERKEIDAPRAVLIDFGLSSRMRPKEKYATISGWRSPPPPSLRTTHTHSPLSPPAHRPPGHTMCTLLISGTSLPCSYSFQSCTIDGPAAQSWRNKVECLDSAWNLTSPPQKCNGGSQMYDAPSLPVGISRSVIP